MNSPIQPDINGIRDEAQADLKERGLWKNAEVVGAAIDNGTFTDDMLDQFTPDANPDNQ